MRVIASFLLIILMHDVSAQSLFFIDPQPALKNKPGEHLEHAIKISANPDIDNLDLGDSFDLDLPGALPKHAVISHREIHKNGVVSIRAVDRDGMPIRFSMQAGLIVGTIETGAGNFRLGMQEGQNYLYLPDYLRNLKPLNLDDDFKVPKQSQSRKVDTKTTKSNKPVTSELKEAPVVDLMYVYTQEYANEHGAALDAQMVQITNDVNSYLAKSGVTGRFRLVHTDLTNYPNSNPTFTALQALTENIGVFSEISQTRRRNKADLVVLLRKYSIEHFNESLCGLAWLNGLGFNSQTGTFDGLGDIPKSDSNFGYSVVHQGVIPEVSFCDSSVLAHEIGHNMGLNHDVNNLAAETPSGGVFPYSKGYFVTNSFHTIMSNTFTGVRQFQFSNPNQFCQGFVCGVPGNGASSANAALSLESVFPSVARFAQSSEALVPIVGLILDDSEN